MDYAEAMAFWERCLGCLSGSTQMPSFYESLGYPWPRIPRAQRDECDPSFRAELWPSSFDCALVHRDRSIRSYSWRRLASFSGTTVWAWHRGRWGMTKSGLLKLPLYVNQCSGEEFQSCGHWKASRGRIDSLSTGLSGTLTWVFRKILLVQLQSSIDEMETSPELVSACGRKTGTLKGRLDSAVGAPAGWLLCSSGGQLKATLFPQVINHL